MTFEELTMILLAHKYHYYELNKPRISDYDYDILEKQWERMGLAEERIEEGEHTPCIGFDYNHPFAVAVIYNINKAARP
jgi:NAD-dependent DNA ligase